MVERFFRRLASPIRGLHQAAYVLALLTLASQALALLRDRTFAATFGAGHTLDLYYGAFRIPDLVFALVASLVSAYVLIPRIASASSEETRKLLSHAASFLLIVGGIVSLVLAVFAPDLLDKLYPSFREYPDAGAFVALARLLLLQPILLGLSGIMTSVTQVYRRFALFALSPILYNLGIIFGTLVLYPRFGLMGIGAGVVFGAVLHLAIHVPVLARAGVLPRLVVPSWTILRGIVHDSIPRSLALSMGSLTALALTAIASSLGEGSVSVFTLAGNLEAVPLALIGASYAVAAFPALSEHSGKDRAEFTRILSASSRHIILWSMVFLGLTVVLRAHLVRVILGAGAFDWDATRLTAALLAILAAGLVAQGLVLLFSRALYAARESWRPFFYQLTSFLLTVALALGLLALARGGGGFLPSLAALLRVPDVSGNVILVVALAATLGQIFLVLWSLVALRDVARGLAVQLLRPLLEGALAAAAAGVAAYVTLYFEGGIAALTTLVAVFTEGLLAGIVGLAAAAAVLALLKNEEFRDITAALARLARERGILPPSAPTEAIHP